MKVYSVIGYNSYYPIHDNNMKCFKELEDAENFLKEIHEDPENYMMDFYEIIEIEVY